MMVKKTNNIDRWGAVILFTRKFILREDQMSVFVSQVLKTFITSSIAWGNLRNRKLKIIYNLWNLWSTWGHPLSHPKSKILTPNFQNKARVGEDQEANRRDNNREGTGTHSDACQRKPWLNFRHTHLPIVHPWVEHWHRIINRGARRIP